MVRVVVYRVKDTGKDARYFRSLARRATGVAPFTEVHPGLVRFRFPGDIPDDKVEQLDKAMAEVAEGVRA